MFAGSQSRVIVKRKPRMSVPRVAARLSRTLAALKTQERTNHFAKGIHQAGALFPGVANHTFRDGYRSASWVSQEGGVNPSRLMSGVLSRPVFIVSPPSLRSRRKYTYFERQKVDAPPYQFSPEAVRYLPHSSDFCIGTCTECMAFPPTRTSDETCTATRGGTRANNQKSSQTKIFTKISYSTVDVESDTATSCWSYRRK